MKNRVKIVRKMKEENRPRSFQFENESRGLGNDRFCFPRGGLQVCRWVWGAKGEHSRLGRLQGGKSTQGRQKSIKSSETH
jgi:hypothetical protein